MPGSQVYVEAPEALRLMVDPTQALTVAGVTASGIPPTGVSTTEPLPETFPVTQVAPVGIRLEPPPPPPPSDPLGKQSLTAAATAKPTASPAAARAYSVAWVCGSISAIPGYARCAGGGRCIPTGPTSSSAELGASGSTLAERAGTGHTRCTTTSSARGVGRPSPHSASACRDRDPVRERIGRNTDVRCTTASAPRIRRVCGKSSDATSVESSRSAGPLAAHTYLNDLARCNGERARNGGSVASGCPAAPRTLDGVLELRDTGGNGVGLGLACVGEGGGLAKRRHVNH